MEQTKSARRLKKYLQPGLFTGKIVFIMGVIFLIAYILTLNGIRVLPGTEGYDMIVILIFFIALIASVPGLIQILRLRKQLRELEQTGELPQVLNDFESAESMYNGKVMMGDSYAFGKGCSAVIRYEEVERVFLYEHYTNSIKDERMLKVKMKNGKTFGLCRLKVYIRKEEEETEVMEMVLSHNPDAQIGVN